MRFLIGLILIVLTSSLAIAQGTDARLEQFKTHLVKVYRHPNPERIRALLHPKSLACLQAQPEYEQYLLQAEAVQVLPDDANITVEPVAANSPLPYRGFKFPLRPTHLVRMEFGKKISADGRSATTQIADKYIAQDNNRWYVIMPCPTPEGLGRLRDMGLMK